MVAPSNRRFTLADGMILVAAIAGGIAWTRVVFWSLSYLVNRPLSWPIRVQFAAPLASPALASLAVGLLLVRLRRPRPALRRMSRQPGTMATVAISCSLALYGTLSLGGLALRLLFGPWHVSWIGYESRWVILAHVMTTSGEAVVGVWVMQMLAGRWRPDPHWIDRAGRVLGTAFIALFALYFGAASMNP